MRTTPKKFVSKSRCACSRLKGFGKPAYTESGIVDEYVNVTGGLDDFSYGAFNRRVITNIEIDYADALVRFPSSIN